MSKAKFTKGPWYVNRTGAHYNNPSLENIEVCYGEVDECICDTVYEEADANLIALSPDMYHELERAETMLSAVYFNTGGLGAKAAAERIGRLLAKVRGSDDANS